MATGERSTDDGDADNDEKQPQEKDDEEEDEVDEDEDAGYTSPTPRLRRQLQECRTALSLAEARTLASTRRAAQSKMDLEDTTRKQRCSLVHIAALRDEVRTAESDMTDAVAARDEAHRKLGASSAAPMRTEALTLRSPGEHPNA